MQINFVLDAPDEWPGLRVRLAAMLGALYEIDCAILRENREGIPALYDSGVVYRMEPPIFTPDGQVRYREDWQDIFTSLVRGIVDCEDAASYLAAWRTVREGRPARPVPIMQEGKINGFSVVHVVTEYADGTREDPSKVLRAIEERKGR